MTKKKSNDEGPEEEDPSSRVAAIIKEISVLPPVELSQLIRESEQRFKVVIDLKFPKKKS